MGDYMKNMINDILQDSLRVKAIFIEENADQITALSERIARSFTSDRKLLLCGNGGSAANAQHLAAEFVNRFEMERPPLPAIALTTDTSIITYVGNDYCFDDIFSKQIKAIGLEDDILLAISTSGNSSNILAAAKAAKDMGIYVAGLAGRDGGKLKEFADICMVVKSDVTARVQESHILAGHIICKMVDYILFQRDIPD